MEYDLVFPKEGNEDIAPTITVRIGTGQPFEITDRFVVQYLYNDDGDEDALRGKTIGAVASWEVGLLLKEYLWFAWVSARSSCQNTAEALEHWTSMVELAVKRATDVVYRDLTGED